MSRSNFKGPFFNPNLNTETKNTLKKTNNLSKIRTKNLLILPSHIEQTWSIYNGQKWVLKPITKTMVGHIIGTFIFTRKVCKYKHKIKK